MYWKYRLRPKPSQHEVSPWENQQQLLRRQMLQRRRTIVQYKGVDESWGRSLLMTKHGSRHDNRSGSILSGCSQVVLYSKYRQNRVSAFLQNKCFLGHRFPSGCLAQFGGFGAPRQSSDCCRAKCFGSDIFWQPGCSGRAKGARNQRCTDKLPG